MLEQHKAIVTPVHAVIVPPGGETLAGKEAILASCARAFATSRSDPKTEIAEVVVNGDWALERFGFRESPLFKLSGDGYNRVGPC